MSYKQYTPKNCKIIDSFKKGGRRYLKLNCKKHGEFSLRADTLKDTGCKKCKKENTKLQYDLKWKKECNKIHKGKYDYTNTIVGNVLKKSDIKCNDCGLLFKQTPASHKSGRGCPKCGIEDRINYHLNKAIKKLKDKFKSLGKNYNFNEEEYKTCKDKLKITCDKGHVFLTTPDEIINADRTCTVCSKGYQRSKSEVEVFDFISKYIKCEHNNRKILEGKELDIFIPSIKLAIEFNGIYWHREGNKRTKHIDKKNMCLDKNINLIHIYEDDWVNRKDAVKTKLLSLIFIAKNETINLSIGDFDIIQGDSKIEEIYNKNRLHKDITYEKTIFLKYSGQILGIASYQKYKNTVFIKDIITLKGFEKYNVRKAFIDYLQNYLDSVYINNSIDWLDEIYILKYAGVSNRVKQTPPLRMYIKGTETYADKIKSNKTIKKSGFIIHKI